MKKVLIFIYLILTCTMSGALLYLMARIGAMPATPALIFLFAVSTLLAISFYKKL